MRQLVVEVQVRQPGMTLPHVAHTAVPVSMYPLSHGHAFPDWVRKASLGQAVQFVDVLAQELQLALQDWHWMTPES